VRTNYIAKKLAKEADVGVLSKWLIHDRNDTAACRAPQIGERRRVSELLQQLLRQRDVSAAHSCARQSTAVQ
jgi:hypothetical protein